MEITLEPTFQEKKIRYLRVTLESEIRNSVLGSFNRVRKLISKDLEAVFHIPIFSSREKYLTYSENNIVVMLTIYSSHVNSVTFLMRIHVIIKYRPEILVMC